MSEEAPDGRPLRNMEPEEARTIWSRVLAGALAGGDDLDAAVKIADRVLYLLASRYAEQYAKAMKGKQ